MVFASHNETRIARCAYRRLRWPPSGSSRRRARFPVPARYKGLRCSRGRRRCLRFSNRVLMAGCSWRAARGVEIELLAKLDIDGREPFSDRGGDRPLECNSVSGDRGDRTLRQNAFKPCSTADAPAGNSTHSTDNPAASITRRAAPVTSGPMPSPGIITIVCLAMRSNLIGSRGNAIASVSVDRRTFSRRTGAGLTPSPFGRWLG